MQVLLQVLVQVQISERRCVCQSVLCPTAETALSSPPPACLSVYLGHRRSWSSWK